MNGSISGKKRGTRVAAGLFLALLLLPAALAAAPAGPDWQRDVRPILEKRCWTCHSDARREAGLNLQSREAVLRGGDSGPAFAPGKPDSSLLLKRVAAAGELRMPPAGPALTRAEQQVLRAWVQAGGSFGEQPSGEEPHWSFAPPVMPALPVLSTAQAVSHPVDRFVAARLEREGLQPSPPADRPTLIRRLFLDLLGLLPDPDEVAAFEADRAPGAWERLVDRTLASPHFGERWGKHWLDLARYADSDGYEKDTARPNAYLYRDWVIDAINRDLPFDHFTIEQLAGDLLPSPTMPQQIATGFHRNTLTNKEGGVDQEEFRIKAVVDRAATTGSVWMGLTVGCAECHSHKYDPISQREFYGLFAFFNSGQEVDLPYPTEEEKAELRKRLKAHQGELAGLRARLDARIAELAAAPATLPPSLREMLASGPPARTEPLDAALAAADPGYDALLKELRKKEAATPAVPQRKAMVLQAAPKPPPTHILIRGDFLRPGEPVEPHTPAVLPPLAAGGDRAPTRLDLARWLVDGKHPLTARVEVNRTWQSLFGRGLVATPDDWGARGERPSHPELLDWLAVAFSSPQSAGGGLGWRRKALIRLIVTSRTYRQSSRLTPALAARDPRNVLLARQARTRVEAEVVRDLALDVSRLLTPRIGGPSIRPPLPADIAALGYADSIKWPESKGPDRYRRGMYIFIQRTVPYPLLTTFDGADASLSCTRRERSNTPLQALTLLNDPVFVEAAAGLAGRVLREMPVASPSGRIERMVRIALARAPEPAEKAALLGLYVDASRALAGSGRGALTPSELPPGLEPGQATALAIVARTLINSDAFITRE